MSFRLQFNKKFFIDLISRTLGSFLGTMLYAFVATAVLALLVHYLIFPHLANVHFFSDFINAHHGYWDTFVTILAVRIFLIIFNRN